MNGWTVLGKQLGYMEPSSTPYIITPPPSPTTPTRLSRSSISGIAEVPQLLQDAYHKILFPAEQNLRMSNILFRNGSGGGNRDPDRQSRTQRAQQGAIRTANMSSRSSGLGHGVQNVSSHSRRPPTFSSHAYRQTATAPLHLPSAGNGAAINPQSQSQQAVSLTLTQLIASHIQLQLPPSILAQLQPRPQPQSQPQQKPEQITPPQYIRLLDQLRQSTNHMMNALSLNEQQLMTQWGIEKECARKFMENIRPYLAGVYPQQIILVRRLDEQLQVFSRAVGSGGVTTGKH